MERRVIVEINYQPLVSVPVITYNSSKFVLETLESIKAQTYQNIELIISDDCSTDNTVELCQNWVEQHKERFVRTLIITSEMNTGISANLNRAEVACQGEWVKPIAGDDILVPDCLENTVAYVQIHSEVIYLFGRIEAFGQNEEKNRYFSENVFDYSFFDMDVEGQLERLVFGANCIPASTFFYNRQKSIELGIKNDERIPLLEDWPKWINILDKGIRLEFMNKIIVKYRCHEEALSTSMVSKSYYRSCCLFDMYYRYPRWIMKDAEIGVNKLVEQNVAIYNEYIMVRAQLSELQKSCAYIIGNYLLRPVKIIKKILNDIRCFMYI